MAISTKGKRLLKIGERRFFWRIRLDEYARKPMGAVLTIVSEDKKFYVIYELGQHEPFDVPFHPRDAPVEIITYPPKAADEIYLQVRGPEFKWPENTERGWTINCPVWENDGIIKPADVRRLIEWSLGEK